MNTNKIMALPSLNKETIDKVRAKAGVDEMKIKEAVEVLKNWLQLQPHLPHDYDEGRLERLFMRCKGSVERAKETLDMYYTVRSAIPEIFSNRDPHDPWFLQASSIRCFIALPELTDDFDRVSLITYLDQDSSKYNVYDVLKMVFMVVEVRAIEDYNFAEIFIIDLENITMGHVVKYTLPVLRRLQISGTKAFKARVKGIHFINVAPFVDTTVHIFRSLMKPKLASRVHIHRKGSRTLLEHVPTKILPAEYGGNAGSIHEHWTAWKKKLESYREWFLEQENVRVDETKRPGKAFDMIDLFGFEGSFRQLSFD